MSLSDITPSALNSTKIGIGFFILGICIKMLLPIPLFFEEMRIDICFGDMHLLSGTDLISADQAHLLLFFEMLKQ
jgi:hypothetical protein